MLLKKIHGELVPENIFFDPELKNLKFLRWGNTFLDKNELDLQFLSRYYRAPEVYNIFSFS